jgi:phosphoglycerate dehydrogenase-like enzyme
VTVLRVAVIDDHQAVALTMADWSVLDGVADIEVFQDHLDDEAALVGRLRPFDVVVAMRERTAFPRSLLERLSNLKLLVFTGAKTSVIDLAAATDAGIVVCGTRHLVISAEASVAAEHTWGLILALAKHIPDEDAAIRAGGWQTRVGVTLAGKTLGILGLGRLGARVASYGHAFGMTVIAWSENLTEDRAREHGVLLVDRDDLMRQADVVTVHLQLSGRTRGLLGARELGLMKQTALLVNTARGPIVDEQSLLETLRNRGIAGAALDVFDEEPLPLAHPFRELDNVIVTPHSAYVTEENYRTYYEDVVGDIAAFAAGAPIRTLNLPGDRWELTKLAPVRLIYGRPQVTWPSAQDGSPIIVRVPIVRSDGAPLIGDATCEATIAGTAVSAAGTVTGDGVTLRLWLDGMTRAPRLPILVRLHEAAGDLEERFELVLPVDWRAGGDGSVGVAGLARDTVAQ